MAYRSVRLVLVSAALCLAVTISGAETTPSRHTAPVPPPTPVAGAVGTTPVGEPIPHGAHDDDPLVTRPLLVVRHAPVVASATAPLVAASPPRSPAGLKTFAASSRALETTGSGHVPPYVSMVRQVIRQQREQNDAERLAADQDRRAMEEERRTASRRARVTTAMAGASLAASMVLAITRADPSVVPPRPPVVIVTVLAPPQAQPPVGSATIAPKVEP